MPVPPSRPRPRPAHPEPRSPRRPALVRGTVLLATAAVLGLTATPAQAEEPAGPVAPAAAPEVVEGPAAQVGQEVCDPVARPGAVALARLVLDTYRVGSNGGIVRDCATGGRSEHKEGRAWDWLVRADQPAERAAAEEFLGWLTAPGPDGAPGYQARRLGVTYAIWAERIWSPDRGWRPYGGADPHTGHVHVSLSWSGALGVTSFWTGVPARVDQGACAAAAADAGVPGPCPPPDAPPADAPVPAPLPGPPPAEVPTAEHTVAPGDTLGQLALDRGTTVEDLVARNGLTSTVIMVGQVLQVPAPAPAPAPAPEPAPVPVLAEVAHTVVPGDTLWQLARDSGTTVTDLQARNGLAGTLLTVGQQVLVPAT
ncbi:LysM peptidoglycan-binding domain-containing protein [Modestobacter sp. SYSU DS0657]